MANLSWAASWPPWLPDAAALSGFEPPRPPWLPDAAALFGFEPPRVLYNQMMLSIVDASMKCNVCTAWGGKAGIGNTSKWLGQTQFPN